MSRAAIGVGCGAAILRGGRILLVKRLKAPEAGCWSLAGGRIEFFERAEDAARREALEEVGVTIEIGPLLCVAQTIGPDGQHWLAPVYRAALTSGEPVNREPDKIAAIGWFDPGAPPAPLAMAAQQAIAALGTGNGAG
ncbi:MAG: NUDIX domain-containing protein [Roseiarcus sp.]